MTCGGRRAATRSGGIMARGGTWGGDACRAGRGGGGMSKGERHFMLTLICATEEEVCAVRRAWAERRLDDALGGHPFAVWLGETFRFGTDGTEPTAAGTPGRHARTGRSSRQLEAAPA